MSTAVAARTAESVLANERIVSADSHIMEPADLWEKNLPASLKGKYPKYPARNSPGEKPGGWDPKARLADQDKDGVAAEIIYPTVGMLICNHPDIDYKKACFDAYNLWIAEY